jgi:histidine triad (HIT) family protein
MMSCVFCGILRNELSASRIFESPLLVAFLDIVPINVGHTLIVPRRHVESFTDLTSEEASQLFLTGKLLATHLKRNLEGCEGISVTLADGVSAGQEVPHAHLHIIPRRANDGFRWKFPPHYRKVGISRSELDSVAARIKESLETRGELQ